MNLIISILVGLGTRLLTEQFIGKMIYLSLKELSKKTDSDIDNEMVEALGKALGVSGEP